MFWDFPVRKFIRGVPGKCSTKVSHLTLQESLRIINTKVYGSTTEGWNCLVCFKEFQHKSPLCQRRTSRSQKNKVFGGMREKEWKQLSVWALDWNTMVRHGGGGWWSGNDWACLPLKLIFASVVRLGSCSVSDLCNMTQKNHPSSHNYCFITQSEFLTFTLFNVNKVHVLLCKLVFFQPFLT